jgi:histidinol-phosphate aminotransferase
VTTIDDLVRDELRALDKYEIPHPTGIRAKLDANEFPLPLDPDVAEGLGRELARVELNRYPDGEAHALRAYLAGELKVEEGWLAFGNGSDELIALLIAAFSRPRPGGGGGKARMLYPWPSFVVYRIASLANGTQPLEVPLRDDFTLDAGHLERAMVAGRPNVAFFALPNNPTGSLWARDDVAGLLKKHPDTIIVADEAYFDYSGETMIDLLAAHPNLVILRTLSKIGLAALRVGYLVAHPNVVRQIEKIRPPYNVGSLNQAAALWLLREHGGRIRARIAAVVEERERMAKALAELPGVTAFPSRANHILIKLEDATGAWQRLVDKGVLVRNFDKPGPLKGCLRVTVGTPAENDLFLEAMRG